MTLSAQHTFKNRMVGKHSNQLCLNTSILVLCDFHQHRHVLCLAMMSCPPLAVITNSSNINININTSPNLLDHSGNLLRKRKESLKPVTFDERGKFRLF